MPKIPRPTRPLGDVNVLPQKDGSHEIVVKFMPDPDLVFGEGDIKAFMALDASASMRQVYGYGGGPFMDVPNYAQGIGRKIGEIITALSRTGKASAIYWAVSPDGSKTEMIGEFDEDGWSNASIRGPKKEKWGKGTKLLPAIKYGYETLFKGADGAFGAIVTDGIIEDEQECLKYCLDIGKTLEGKKPEPFKLVLIGVGAEVDEEQLERFDDMFEGTNVDYDLWGSGLVPNMENEEDIIAVLFAELVTEEMIVAPTGSVEDGSGKQIMEWTDGMPGSFRFILPKGQTEFVLRAAGNEIRQDISSALGNP